MVEDFGKSEDIFSTNLDKVCRTCTKAQSESLHQIFNSEILILNEEESMSTSEMLFAVSTLKMLPVDDLPKGICIQCLSSLKKAYYFQKMCILSDLTLRSVELNNRKTICCKKDQSSRIKEIKNKSGKISVFGPPMSCENKDRIINNLSPKVSEPIVYCENKIVGVLKNEQTCDDLKPKVYIEQRRNIKEEEYENNSSLPDKHEADYEDTIESINPENKEDNLAFKKGTLSEPINQEVESPNPRNKRNACFICEDCGKSFDRQHRLRRHLSVHKKEGRPFECEHCKRRFAQEEHLRRHDITHDKTFLQQTDIKNIDGHQCSECPRKFLKQVSLASHMKTHRKEINISKSYQCEECLKIFEGIQRLNRHKKIHEENHKYVCDACGQTFGLKSHLIDHLNKHGGIKPHTCRYCEKSFQQAGTLKDHLRTHTGEQPYLCSECGKAFKSASNLRQHQLRHKGIKPYQCLECPSKFMSKSDLSKHTNTHRNEKPYTCDICGSRFTKNSSLTKHKRIIHSGEKTHQCDCCEMRFSSSDHMKRHMRTHTGEKPYACKYCERKFSQSNDMIKHLRTHVGENVYKCEECDASFRLNTELKKHIADHYQAQMKNDVTKRN